ncbi:MAG: molybdopterin molybdotransferase [Gammaproteobacteria bacterium]|nr:MAG: molybdopterin molybdotransferase [Gammaproteobacteria bacterium]TND06806.1 MAG: molybdopterin molybdotransferase [Gammaproteobacteria bacterium]
MNDVSPLIAAQQRYANAVPFRALPAQSCRLTEAPGRVLSADFVAPMDAPPYSRAIAEGFVVHTGDSRGADEKAPVRFRVTGVCNPGDAQCPTFGKGEAVSVVTGSIIPDGEYSVVRMWDCERSDDGFSITRPFAPRFFIEDRGCDHPRGKVVVSGGTLLGPAEIGSIASFGVATVDVARLPVVKLFSSGNEVIPLTEKMRPGAIFDCNAPMLSAAVAQCGATPVFGGIMHDDFDAFVVAVRQALRDADMVLISGGTAVGGRDFIADLVAAVGELIVNGVPMKSGKPLIMGIAGGKPLVCVAGHPPEALRGFRLFGVPALHRLTGRNAELPVDE